MASNELMITAGSGKLSLPAHIAARFRPEDSNILSGDRTPSLTIRGKVFTLNIDGEVTPLMKPDEDGNEYPLPSLPVIILDYAAKPGRSYYEGAFEPNDVKPPTCWSLDGVTPEAEVPDEVKTETTSWKCAGCPMSIKGSAVTDTGKTATACSVHRILAVVPRARMDMPPLRLRIAQTSNYDGRSPDLKEKGLFAFQNYLDYIKGRGIPHTQSVVTRLSFDPTTAYPKLLFKAVRYVEDAEIAQIDAILATGKVEEILGRTGTMALKADPTLAAPRAAPALTAPKVAPTVDEGTRRTAQEAQAVARAAAPKPAPKPEPAPAPVQEDDEETEVLATLRAGNTAKLTEDLKASVAEAPIEDDAEAALERQLAAIRAKKAAASASTAEAPAEAPAAPKRTRRTKEQITADAAPKAAAPAPAAAAVNGSDMGGDEDESELAPTVPKQTAAPKAAAKAVEAPQIQVPPDVEKVLTSWDD